ncbi:MAG: DUF362 domain-containing protein [Planctomycetes bacterium]|nr:DUF362 domain-containing protein [Planctomycetota bacterium]
MADKARVCIRRAESYEPSVVEAAVGAAVEALGGWGAFVRPGDRVLVKPNCISATPADQHAQTHPAVILEVCRQLLDFGARPFVGDSPAWSSLEANLGKLGILPDLARLGVPVVSFNRPVHTDNPRGHVFRRLTVDRAALEADAIVNLPKLKAHRQLLMTVVIKNMFGCVNGRRKAWWHVKAGSYENYFANMLVDVFEMLRPAVNIVDAIVAMEGKGPVNGTPRPMGLVMASTDGPALERVVAHVVGVKPGQLRTLHAARELGVGTPWLEQIEVDGPPLDELRVTDFDLPRLIPIGFSIPRFVKGSFRQAWMTRLADKAQASECV